MKDLFVSYEIAKQLKEKGFNEPCLAWYEFNYPQYLHYPYKSFQSHSVSYDKIYNEYTEKISASLYQQVVDWLFEKHKIAIMYSPQKDILEIDILRAIELIKN